MRQNANANVNCIKHTTGGRIGFPSILKTETNCPFDNAITSFTRTDATRNKTN